MYWQNWLNAILGIWLILSPFILGYGNVTSATWNDIIVGILLAVVAGWVASARVASSAPKWFCFILGIWLIFSPFILGFSGQAVPFWNNIIIGIVSAVLAAWAASMSPTEAPVSRA